MNNFEIESTDGMLDKIQSVIDFYKMPEVTGILLYGGWGRGEQLPDSDVDIAVICKNQQAIERTEDTWWEINGYFVDLALYDYEHLLNQPLPERIMRDDGYFWKEDNRFNWQQSKILHDPSGKIKELLEQKAYLPANEAKANLDVIVLVLERSLNYHLPRYIGSKKYVEAQMLMDRMIIHLVHYIYNQNSLLMPYSSAAFYWFDKKDLLGKQSVLDLFSNTGLNKNECLQRMKLFWEVCDKLGIKLIIRTQKEYLQYFFELNGTKKWGN